MASQAPLIPSLYAILPAQHQQTLVDSVSLMALHCRPFHIQDDMYTSTPLDASSSTTQTSRQPPRMLRFRTERVRRKSSKPSSDVDPHTWQSKGDKGKDKASDVFGDDQAYTSQHSVAYVSQPLSGREYAEMSVKAVLGLDILGMSTKVQIQEFLDGLGLTWVSSSQLG